MLQTPDPVMSSCIHKDVCSGCSWMDLTAENQRLRKIQALTESLLKNKISWSGVIDHKIPGNFHLRDRADLTYSQEKYGFYRKESRDIFAVESCPQMSTPLQNLFEELRQISLPIEKGSIRLRVSYSEHAQPLKGLWLDFSNQDVKHLFEEKITLHQLMKLGVVEIGQRRKRLEFRETDGRFHLLDPIFEKWTRTWQGPIAFPLYSLIGSFTQTGDLANHALIQTLESLLTKTTAQRWVEFGCGNGNLTLPLAGSDRNVLAVEFDEPSLEGLRKTLSVFPELQERITLATGDFQRKHSVEFQGYEGILVNPPRSGLGKFLDPLLNQKQRPLDLIYMSCFLESFSQDGIQIQNLGYQLEDLVIVDQFPQTPHFEILSRWKLEKN